MPNSIPLDLDHYIRYEAFFKYSEPLDEHSRHHTASLNQPQSQKQQNSIMHRGIFTKSQFKLLFISIFGYSPPKILSQQMHYPITWTQFSKRILQSRLERIHLMDWYREVWREFDATGKGYIEWDDWKQALERIPSSEGREAGDSDDHPGNTFHDESGVDAQQLQEETNPQIQPVTSYDTDSSSEDDEEASNRFAHLHNPRAATKEPSLPFRDLIEECIEEFGRKMRGRMNFREFCEMMELAEMKSMKNKEWR